MEHDLVETLRAAQVHLQPVRRLGVEGGAPVAGADLPIDGGARRMVFAPQPPDLAAGRDGRPPGGGSQIARVLDPCLGRRGRQHQQPGAAHTHPQCDTREPPAMITAHDASPCN